MKVMYLKRTVIISCLTVIVCTCGVKKESDMPAFHLLLTDSVTVLSSNRIPVGKPIMLVLFSPDCEHCQEETKDILNNINQLRNIRIYFITVDPFDRMKVFSKYYQLFRYSNIIVGRDSNFDLLKQYNIPTMPFIVLYNKYKQAKAIIKGPLSAKQIIEQVNKL